MIDPTVRHLYVHVPFCATVCPFCAFDVRTTRDADIDRYLERLEQEAVAAGDRLTVRPDTVYVGGGTPSQLDDARLARLVDIVGSRFGWAREEATIELHPADVTPGRCRRLVDMGFNRLSVGVQSTDDVVLGFLGRSHDARRSLAAVDDALDAARCASPSGSVHVSVDLIVAVPGQDWRRDLEVVAGLGVDHVSTYTLTIEAGTPFARRGVEVEEGDELDALAVASEVLGRVGIERYEVSNHARPGAECRHNGGYWRNECWIGLGPSAGGHEPAGDRGADGSRGGDAVTVRTTNPRGAEWLDATGEREVSSVDAVTWWADAVACGIRMVGGVDLLELERRVGVGCPAPLSDTIERLIDRGWLRRTQFARWAPAPPGASPPQRGSPKAGPSECDVVSATPAGLLVADRIQAEIW